MDPQLPDESCGVIVTGIHQGPSGDNDFSCPEQETPFSDSIPFADRPFGNRVDGALARSKGSLQSSPPGDLALVEVPTGSSLDLPDSSPDAKKGRIFFTFQDSPLILWCSHFVPADANNDPEIKRRGQLFIAFSFLGVVFGLLFASFYLAISHPWGAAIVLACTVIMACAPWIIRRAGLVAAGNMYAGILVLGFTGLTAIEGGIHGHAVAWLAVVPLCACILVDRKMGRRWCLICLMAMGVFCGLDISGIKQPILYPKTWEDTITAAGYLSLTVFMSLVGLAFENGRRRSLTKLQEALEALSAAKKEAEQAKVEAERTNLAKSEFLSRMSHELRTPLNAILGFGEYLKAQETREIPLDCLGHIVTAGTHLLGLINEVLDISRIESGHMQLTIELVQVSRVVEEALDLIRGAAQARQIKLRWNSTPDASRWVLVDAKRLKQVLLNLLSNAVKYNVEKGTITVSCKTLPDERICLEVADTGMGIPQDKIGRLFVAFDRLGVEGSGVQGTGLGLALSKSLVEALGGAIAVSSEPGIGTTFRVFLPAASAGKLDPAVSDDAVRNERPEEPADALAIATSKPSGGKVAARRTSIEFTRQHHVLYIEDNDPNYRLVHRFMGAHPLVAVTRAVNASEGLDRLRENVPDLLLLDLQLPDLSGQDVLARLRADPRTRDLPVVVLSADATQASIRQLLGDGADAYITKPLNLQLLLKTMHELLEGGKRAAKNEVLTHAGVVDCVDVVT